MNASENRLSFFDYLHVGRQLKSVGMPRHIRRFYYEA